MTKEQECKLMVSYAQALFTGTPFDAPALEPLPLHYFSADAWKEAFRALQSHKAVPWFSASVEGWKQQVHAVAPLLERFSQTALCSANPRAPLAWSQVQLAWLAKPNKSPSCPRNLRTIGLMSPDSKAFLIILKKQAETFTQVGLQDVPQYAYRAGASTADAILRGSSHCRHIRQVLERTATDLTSRILRQTEARLVGGLMCGLDLSQAFDRLEYSEMYLALCDTGMPIALAKLLLTVHSQTALHIVHGSHRGTVSMSRGLRQGCPIAPLIYTAWVIRLCRKLNSDIHPSWPAKHMSIYADDKHCHWEIANPRSLFKAIAQLRTRLNTLRGCGMEVSIAKCVAVLALKGAWAKQALKKVVKFWNGQRVHR